LMDIAELRYDADVNTTPQEEEDGNPS